MNKMKLALLVAGSLVAGASTSAFAEGQGTVTFNGKLITETCEITSLIDQTVNLDAVSIKTLNGSGKEGGFKAFNIAVDCPASPTEFTQVGIHFEPVGETTPWDPATGNLKNNSTAADAAENVQVKIYNTNDGVQHHAKIGEVSKWVTAAAGANTFYYAGGYYATDATTAGPVTAKVQYTLVYQ